MSDTVREATCRRLASILLLGCAATAAAQQASENALHVRVEADGKYSIGLSGSKALALTAGVGAEVDGRWLRGADYPHHEVKQIADEGYLGAADEWQVTWTGLQSAPDLVYRLRAYSGKPFADIQVTVHNGTGATIHVQAIRAMEASGGSIADLGGPVAEDRVLSDSFSEDRPAMKIHDLADAKDKMHRAVGSQLIYNRQSHQSLFLGALKSDRFLTILRLHVDDSSPGEPHISAFEADSTGTTELELENSLEHSPAQDRVELSLPVAPGGDLSSEELALSVGTDYHEQLETYGSLIRQIHHARVAAPPLMGWWSWTAWYFGLNEGAALANAEWESQHLKSYGYNVFHIDEGYQYARGEYVTPNAVVFPHGVGPVEYQIRGLGLTPGIWTAPFEVAERSWVFESHPDWLVKNAKGKPIHAGFVDDDKEQLYVLDTTNPGAQDYLRETYSKLVHEWGIHYFKLDFMDDTAIEGYYSKPDTTAMEAQRIGLKIIRDAVGDDVLLDKDGSVMMNPVGYVDYGRISQDTGHTFDASHDAVTGIAARYYMNRNYFVADPDAFTVSTQTIPDQSWHESTKPATLDEARVSIALAAVSGGMLEIGDNLPSLENSPERVALIENQDLIDMVRLGRASKPVDLMSYASSDTQPSIFLLKESNRQSILTVFNWTENKREHAIRLADLGLPAAAHYAVSDALDAKTPAQTSPLEIHIELPPHSVRVLKIIDQNARAQHPVLRAVHPAQANPGEGVTFSAEETSGNPVLSYKWDFGDGTQLEGPRVTHAWTGSGNYDVHVTASGLDSAHANEGFKIHISGKIATDFNPGRNRRFETK
jgi:alpha-galactosidase